LALVIVGEAHKLIKNQPDDMDDLKKLLICINKPYECLCNYFFEVVDKD
jgi:hypothetical protein